MLGSLKNSFKYYFQYDLLEFSEHYQAYTVGGKENSLKINNISSFQGPPVKYHKKMVLAM